MPTILDRINELTLALETIAAGVNDYEVKAVAYAVETAAQTAGRRDLRHLFDVPLDALPVTMPPVTTGRQAEPTAKRRARRIDAAILRVIADAPGVTGPEIAARLHVSRAYVSTNVTRLAAAGRVRAVEDCPSVRFYPAGEGVQS